MKNIIILEKAWEEKKLSEGIADTTLLAEMAQVSSSIDFAGRCKWAMSNVDLDTTKELGLTGIKKY